VKNRGKKNKKENGNMNFFIKKIIIKRNRKKWETNKEKTLLQCVF
jgi:hypothetical protein